LQKGLSPRQVGRTSEQLKSYKTGFEAALKRADREDFRFHDLRHSAGPGITATLLQATGFATASISSP